jgi:hypothetical protein
MQSWLAPHVESLNAAGTMTWVIATGVWAVGAWWPDSDVVPAAATARVSTAHRTHRGLLRRAFRKVPIAVGSR